MKIIFLDIDGPLIPGRMYHRGDRLMNQDRSSFYYDPIAVDHIRALCQMHDAKVVFNSMHCHNGHDIMLHQAKMNGFADFMYQGSCCTKLGTGPSRAACIDDWLNQYEPKAEWIVIDDADVGTNRQVKVDFDIGMTLENFLSAHELFGGKRPTIICARGEKLATEKQSL